MKLNRKGLRKLILKEIKDINESQKSVGLPHKYSNEELYRHALKYISDMRQKNGLGPYEELAYGTPDYNNASFLLKIVDNAVQQAVKYDSGNLKYSWSDRKMTGRSSTPDHEMDYMREEQGKLKMVRYALAKLLGVEYRYSGGGGRAEMSARMRELDPTGSKQRYGSFQPSDDPQLRKNMPEYQPGGRFYDPDDPIHNM